MSELESHCDWRLIFKCNKSWEKEPKVNIKDSKIEKSPVVIDSSGSEINQAGRDLNRTEVHGNYVAGDKYSRDALQCVPTSKRQYAKITKKPIWTMRIDIITIFPKMFGPVLNESMVKRAQDKGLVKINIIDLRDYSLDKHKKVDDHPFGGGPGMVMCPEPIFRAVEDVIRGTKDEGRKTKIILLSPQGKKLDQRLAKRLAKCKHLILICGHYEGVDERVRKFLVDEEISIGDYVLTGGEIPSMVLVDSVVRLIPGVLGKEESLTKESFSDNLLEYPQYTRPANFKSMRVPSVLLSGNHKKIELWRKVQAIKRTKEKRPDLLR